jgi:hypothetical protein
MIPWSIPVLICLLFWYLSFSFTQANLIGLRSHMYASNLALMHWIIGQSYTFSLNFCCSVLPHSTDFIMAVPAGNQFNLSWSSVACFLAVSVVSWYGREHCSLCNQVVSIPALYLGGARVKSQLCWLNLLWNFQLSSESAAIVPYIRQHCFKYIIH